MGYDIDDLFENKKAIAVILIVLAIGVVLFVKKDEIMQIINTYPLTVAGTLFGAAIILGGIILAKGNIKQILVCLFGGLLVIIPSITLYMPTLQSQTWYASVLISVALVGVSLFMK